MAWPVMVFDIESIPDVKGLRALGEYDAALTDQEVHAQWAAARKADNKSDFMPLHLQRILCISVVFRNAEGLRIHSFVDRDDASEGKIIQQFFGSLEKHVPQLVSWNGGGFDLPVLHYRGLIHGASAHKYWDMGEGGDHDSREFKWNNYISRYHLRHLDMMDLLAMYQPKANAPLDAMAKLCGFPGKLGMDGSKVYEAYLAGGQEDIRRYCETDVMNTYLLYCRFQKMRGGFTEKEYEQEISFVKGTLADLSPNEAHWDEYLKAWSA
jgi:predicted PolB exonuclease-like 3'-5' exonuclease